MYLSGIQRRITLTSERVFSFLKQRANRLRASLAIKRKRVTHSLTTKTRKTINRISQYVKEIEPYFVAHETILLFLYLALFEGVIFYGLPAFVGLQVIIPVLVSILTVEGVLIGLGSQFDNEAVRNYIGVEIGVPCLIITLTTIVISTFQSIQLKFLSTDLTTLLFKISAGLFGLLVEVYALGLIFPPIKRRINNPQDTVP